MILLFLHIKCKDEYDNWDISEEDLINRLTPGFISDIPVFLNYEMITSRIDLLIIAKWLKMQ